VAEHLRELTRRSQDNLIGFLRIEVELAKTFYKISKNTKDVDHRAKLQKDVGMAIKTKRQFVDRINDPAVQKELNVQADRLERISASARDSWRAGTGCVLGRSLGGTNGPDRISLSGLGNVAAVYLGDVGQQLLRYGRTRLFDRNIRRGRIPVTMLNQKPFCSGRASDHGSDQRPGAAELRPVQGELQLSRAKSRIDIRNLRDPKPAIPYHHRSASILTLRNHSLKRAIFKGMIFDGHRQPLHGWIQGWSLRYRPRKQHSTPLQPEIVVQVACLVLLHHEG
jgi:hypothetical protein